MYISTFLPRLRGNLMQKTVDDKITEIMRNIHPKKLTSDSVCYDNQMLKLQ